MVANPSVATNLILRRGDECIIALFLLLNIVKIVSFTIYFC